MKVEQIYQLVNTAAQAVAGEIALPKEDLSNIVDVGKFYYVDAVYLWCVKGERCNRADCVFCYKFFGYFISNNSFLYV